MIILYINRLHVCHIILLIEMNANDVAFIKFKKFDKICIKKFDKI